MAESRIIAGINAVREAMASPSGVERLFLQTPLNNPRVFEILKLGRKARVPISLVPEGKLDRLAGLNHQGAAACVPEKVYATLDAVLENAEKKGEPPFLLIPEGVEDPQNLGALIRTAVCAGVHGVVLPMTGAAGLTPGTSRASAGALSHMDVCREKSMPAALLMLKERGVRLVGLEAGQGKTVWETDLTGPLALVVGGENKGIRPHVRRHLDAVAHLPVRGNMGSLNVSAAASAALYEALRQRIKNGTL